MKKFSLEVNSLYGMHMYLCPNVAFLILSIFNHTHNAPVFLMEVGLYKYTGLNSRVGLYTRL